MFEFLIKKLKAHPRKIVFTEGTDPRILEASARLLSGTFLTPILIGNEEEILAAAEEAGFNIRGAIIIDPEKYENMEAMVERMVERGSAEYLVIGGRLVGRRPFRVTGSSEAWDKVYSRGELAKATLTISLEEYA